MTEQVGIPAALHSRGLHGRDAIDADQLPFEGYTPRIDCGCYIHVNPASGHRRQFFGTEEI